MSLYVIELNKFSSDNTSPIFNSLEDAKRYLEDCVEDQLGEVPISKDSYIGIIYKLIPVFELSLVPKYTPIEDIEVTKEFVKPLDILKIKDEFKQLLLKHRAYRRFIWALNPLYKISKVKKNNFDHYLEETIPENYINMILSGSNDYWRTIKELWFDHLDKNYPNTFKI